MTQVASSAIQRDDEGLPPSKYLCLIILGYRKRGISEQAYRRHMIEVSAPLTKDPMVKDGIKIWTVIHNPVETRELMGQLFDSQMVSVADYDCFSQVVFESLEHYKNLKADPWYKARLFGDHEKFADTERSRMTMYFSSYFIDTRFRLTSALAVG
ncbi:hypothetical protein LTR56_026136 [Elasticomyces elasticus]|nr:hypothetical protein LTR56_026136 [Elasticomyces elasticus]KAK3620704.1 hypothetical protein LTR22_025484 [Elasticomyces elasticus]